MGRLKHGLRIGIASSAIVSAGFVLGLFEAPERTLLQLRYELIHRPASQSLTVVSIDRASLARLNEWPWPRRYHAEAIAQLSSMGARRIGMDIDFSSRSEEGSDSALERAISLSRAPVVLPLFHQPRSPGSEDMVTALPLQRFGDSALVGSVNLQPEPDGRIWRYAAAHPLGGTIVPSLAGALAVLDPERPSSSSWLLDFSIDVGSIPVVSFVDVLDRRVEAALVQGRTILIGATALELGDQFSVPKYRVLPGVLIQALAYESMIQGRQLRNVPPWLTLALTTILITFCSPWLIGASLGQTGIRVIGAVFGVLAIPLLVQWRWPVSIEVTPLLAGLMIAVAGRWIGRVERLTRDAIRHRLLLLQRNALMRVMAESSFDAIVLVDASDRIVRANSAACRVWRRPESALRGANIRELLSPEEDAKADQLGQSHRTRTAELRLDAAETLPVEYTVSEVAGSDRESNSVSRVYTIRDISERRATEAIRQKALLEATAASRAKSEFMAMMSHELRTPLNAIIGFSETMTAELFGALGNPKYKDYAGDIHKAGSRLLVLVNDILDVCRVELGQYELKESVFFIRPVLARVVDLIQPLAEAKGLRLSANAPDSVQLVADERAVKQILHNVVSNAVKFTENGGKVSVEAITEANGDLGIYIRDTGIGIPAEALPLLTRPFYQVDGSLGRRYEGAGVGLSLAARLAELHGGKLRIESLVGEGTLVVTRFPAGRVHRQLQAAV